MKRMLFSLREKGPTRITNLAGRTGINYKRCVRYVNLLRVLGLVEVLYDGGYFVIVTKRGIEISELVDQVELSRR